MNLLKNNGWKCLWRGHPAQPTDQLKPRLRGLGSRTELHPVVSSPNLGMYHSLKELPNIAAYACRTCRCEALYDLLAALRDDCQSRPNRFCPPPPPSRPPIILQPPARLLLSNRQ